MKKSIAFFFLLFWGQTFYSQVLGTPLESWDFANGVPDGWTLGSASGIAQWEYRGPYTTPDINICSRGSCGTGTQPIQSVTQFNGFMIFDSNYWDDTSPSCGENIGSGQDAAPHTAWMITNSVNLASTNQIYITFQQQLRSYQGSFSVQYSTDNGITWQTIPGLNQTGIITTPSVQWKSAYIGNLVGGQSNVKFKFLFDGFYYHWCIDDITIYEPSLNNISVSDAQFTNYNELVNPLNNMMMDLYPPFMAPAIVPNCKVNNLGTNDQTNIVVQNKVINATTNTVVYDQSSAAFDVTLGSIQPVLNPAFNSPSTIGDYYVTFEATQTEIDEDLSNNTDTLDYSIHPYSLAKDEGPADNIYNNNNLYPNTTTTQVGVIYKFPFNTQKKIFSMDVGIGEGTLPGTVIQGFIYVPTMDQILATTDPYTVNLADINGIGEEKMITLPLTTPLPITSGVLNYPDIVVDSTTMETMANPFIGSVAAMVRNMSPGQPFYIARSGEAVPNTTYLHFPDEQDLYYLLRTPQVRLNLFGNTQIPGCMVDTAMNYNPLASVSDGSCDFPGCTQSEFSNYNANATWDDGSCAQIGCLDPLASNYNPNATQIVDCIYMGCTDPTAVNFNPSAAIEDGSCLYGGCLDPTADNYDPNADVDNGSCYFLGCTDVTADNFDPTATLNDNSCIYSGCTDPTAQNFNPLATIENGTCLYPGCTDVNADNFNPNANLSDGSCIYLGCNDPTAANFDSQANQNDGSCIYPGCTDPTADNYNPTANQNNGTCFYLGCTDNAAANFDPTATVNDGTCIYPGCTDPIASNFNAQANQNDGSCIYPGCTDPTADNFNPTANQNDGSCFYLGCTDNAAANFDPTATVNDGSCIYPGCTDPTANNFNPNANFDDGSCLFYGCTDPIAINFDPIANFNDGSCMFLTASLYTATTQGCDPLSITILNQTVAYPQSVCEFIFSTGDTIYNCNASFNYAFDQPGNYSVTYNYYYDGYLSTASINNIVVHPTPQTPEIIEQNGVLSCINCIPTLNYQWSLNGTAILGANQQTFNNISSGNFLSGDFQLTVSNNFGCSSISNQLNIIQPHFQILDNSICQFQNIELQIDPINVPGVTCTVNWADGNSEIITPGTTMQHNYSINGPLSIEVSCYNNLDTGVYTMGILVYAVPQIPIIVYNQPNITIQNVQSNTNYTWSNNQTSIPFSNNPNLTIFQNNTFNNGWYQVVASNNLGCSSHSDSIFIAEPYFLLNQDNACTSQWLNFQNNTDFENGMSCSINWGDGITDNSNNHFYDMAGSYYITMTCTGFNQTYIQTDSILVLASPETPVIYYSFPTLSVTNFNATESYQWEFNHQPLLNQNNSTTSILFNSAYQNGWYAVSSTNNLGCTTSSDSLPILQPFFNVVDPTVCPGDITSIINQTQAWESTCNIQWGDGYQDVGVLNNPQHVYTDTATYSIQLTCSNPYTTGSYSVEITTNPIPDVPLIQYSFGLINCTNFNTADTYQWTLNHAPLNNQAASSFNTFFNNEYQNGWYQVNATNDWGCTSYSDSLPILQPFFNVVDPTVCPGDITSIINQTQAWESTCNIQWGDGYQDVGVLNNPQHVYTDTATYLIQLTCSNPYTTGSYSVEITTNPIPDIPLIQYAFGQINCTNFNTADTYQWTLNHAPLNNQAGSSLNTFFNNEYQNGWYQVNATNDWGCTSYSDSLPILQPFFNVVDPTVCPGDITSIINQTQAWESTCNIQWGDGYQDVNVLNNPQHVYADTATYLIQLTCSNPYTAGSYSVEITANPIPDQPILQYTIGQVQHINMDPNEIQNWFYNGSNLTLASGSVLNIFNGLNYDNGWYMVSSTNLYGCTSWSDSIFIIQPIFNLDNGVICSSEMANVENITQNFQDLNCTIQWGDGQSSSSISTQFQHQYQWGSEYIISMICSNPFASGYILDTIVVLDAPIPPQILYSVPDIICTNCSADLSYDWNLENNDIPDAITAQWNIWNGTNYTNGTYQLNIISSNGCTSSSDSLTIVQPYFVLDTDSICQFDTTYLQNLTDGLAGMSCQINWADNNQESWSVNPQPHGYNTEGIFEITLFCQETNGTASGEWTQIVNVLPTPMPVLSENNNIISCDNGNSQWITSWSIDNVNQPQFNNTLSLSADLGVEYSMVATTDFGCQGQASITTDYVAPHVNEIDLDIRIYPNPTSEYITLENPNAQYHLSIYDSGNKLVWNKEVFDFKKVIDVSGWPSGLYTMTIQNQNSSKTAQFLIAR